MQTNHIPVETKEVTTIQSIESIDILSCQVDLEVSAKFTVKCAGPNGQTISVQQIVMEGQDYSNWGNDDQYAINFILNKLGLVQKP
jgi:hypothetical protein